MRLPHKEPLIFAKNAVQSDAQSATVEIEFGCLPTLAMMIEAAAQAFAYIQLQSCGSFGVVTMVKNAVAHELRQETGYLCSVWITQALESYYQLSFETLSKENKLIASGELSIKIF